MAREVEESCPTCGSKLEALRRAEMRRCNACRRVNPVAFLYCGYCAAPMENTDLRARVAEIAAPEGGWPSLTSELLQVKFCLQQGELDEAYDLLSILQSRYPGHPGLADFVRSSPLAADEQVGQLVDQVLASSASLSGKLPRRQATEWKAPRARDGGTRTTAHEVVPRSGGSVGDADESATTFPRIDRAAIERAAREGVPKRRPEEAITRPELTVAEATRRAEEQAKQEAKQIGRTITAEAGSKVSGELSVGRSGKMEHETGRSTSGKKGVERTRVYRTVEPRPGKPKMVTVAVDSLQPPRPWTPPEGADVHAPVQGGPAQEITPEDRRKAEEAKRPRKRAAKTSRKSKVVSSKAARKRKRSRPAGTSFGAGILSRYGR